MAFLTNNLGFKKKRGESFRYLHDEIGGGITACSKIKCVSSYYGDCAFVSTEGSIPFDGNIYNPDQGYSSNGVSVFYDQLENVDLSSANVSNGYDSSIPDLCTNGYEYTGTKPYINNASEPWTIVWVVTNYDANKNGFLRFGNDIAPGRNTIEIADYTSYIRFWIRVQPSNLDYRVLLDGFPLGSWGEGVTKIFMFTNDGGLLSSSFQFYVNDMIVPLSKTVQLDDTPLLPTAFQTNQNAFVRLNNNGGLRDDIHVFNKALTQTERETTKEILEQYYTFS